MRCNRFIKGSVFTVAIAVVLSWLLVSRPLAQGTAKVGVVVTAVDMKDALNKAKPIPGAETTVAMRTVEAGNSHVSVSITRRAMAQDEAITHDRVTEVYQITEGSGTMELGGTLVAGKPFGGANSVIGPSQMGTKIEGGQMRRVTVGDVVIIPPGTPHRWSALEGPNT